MRSRLTTCAVSGERSDAGSAALCFVHPSADAPPGCAASGPSHRAEEQQDRFGSLLARRAAQLRMRRRDRRDTEVQSWFTGLVGLRRGGRRQGRPPGSGSTHGPRHISLSLDLSDLLLIDHCLLA